MKIITFLITILLIISCEHLSFNSDSNKKTTILKEHNSPLCEVCNFAHNKNKKVPSLKKKQIE